MSSRKVVLCGAGFVGKHIARALANPAPLPFQQAPGLENVYRTIQISSRNPKTVYEALQKDIPLDKLTAVPVDITKPATLPLAFEGAHTVVSLVGIGTGTPSEFEEVQWRGVENVAKAAKEAGARVIHFSAIGADPASELQYFRTKGLGEAAVRSVCPDATIVRPSLVFGPDDSFFNRFALLSRFMPFLPVFGEGTAKFQPVYVCDLANLVEVMTRGDPQIEEELAGKIIEAGGPQVHTYQHLMAIILKYAYRRRPVIRLPESLGMTIASIMERLPPNPLTVTRDQIRLLQYDSIADPNPSEDKVPFDEIIWRHFRRAPDSFHKIAPTYLI